MQNSGLAGRDWGQEKENESVSRLCVVVTDLHLASQWTRCAFS